MKTGTVAGARELKTRLGSYLRKVRQGATVVVTDRGAPIAELRPFDDSVAPNAPRLAHLIASGRVTRRGRAKLPPFQAIRMRGTSLATAVAEDREDRF